MNSEEENFNNEFCTWEMVTGESGTFIRVFDLTMDLSNWNVHLKPKDLLEMWYYDNASPQSQKGGSEGAPHFPNGFSLCSALLDQQVVSMSRNYIDLTKGQ